jgi:NDP-sugar pyrophosphorylase family protein
VAKLKEGDVTSWTEKPTLNLNVGTGVVVLEASTLRELEPLSQQYGKLDLMSHLIPRLIETEQIVHAYVTNAFWLDVGSTERYEKLDNELVDSFLPAS